MYGRRKRHSWPSGSSWAWELVTYNYIYLFFLFFICFAFLGVHNFLEWCLATVSSHVLMSNLNTFAMQDKDLTMLILDLHSLHFTLATSYFKSITHTWPLNWPLTPSIIYDNWICHTVEICIYLVDWFYSNF